MIFFINWSIATRFFITDILMSADTCNNLIYYISFTMARGKKTFVIFVTLNDVKRHLNST